MTFKLLHQVIQRENLYFICVSDVKLFVIYVLCLIASGRAFTEVPGAREVAKRSGRKPERCENSDHHNNFKVDVLTA